jgi:FKBP-type peptidyl-prolyl cis-trans isomerase SlyD
MEIEKNKVVALTYVLKYDNASGETIEVADERDPLIFLFGNGGMLPKFEENLSSLKSGDHFEFLLSKDDAYGDFTEEAIVELSKDIFRIEGEIDEEMLKPGSFIPMQDQDGHPLQGKVLSVDESNVKMDFNHPMAGKNLHFTGEIVEVRDASEEELSHGHVHGHGGHHHE